MFFISASNKSFLAAQSLFLATDFNTKWSEIKLSFSNLVIGCNNLNRVVEFLIGKTKIRNSINFSLDNDRQTHGDLKYWIPNDAYKVFSGISKDNSNSIKRFYNINLKKK